MSEKLKAEDVAAHLRKAIRGEITVSLGSNKTRWYDVYCGDVELLFGDWVVVIFNDCFELDYIDSVKSADGLIGEFDDWEINPISVLSLDECAALESIVVGAR